MEPDVHVGPRESCPVLSRRLAVTLADIGLAIGTAFQDVYRFIGARGLSPAGPPFVIYHGDPRQGQPFDIEICAPVAGAAAGAPPGWQARELPAGLFATVVHVGPYETLGTAYAAIGSWIGAHHLAPAGPPREVYLSEPGTPSNEIKTLIELPVIEAASVVPAG
jgi:effector-binding domain-containing protein